mgnify:CR=1 FL=1
MKKLTSLFLIVCMIFVMTAVPIIVTAAGSISGPDIIYKPAEGKMTYIPYTLSDNAAGTYTWRIANEISGIEVDENGYVSVSGDVEDRATFTLEAAGTDGSVICSKEITVRQIAYSFEGFGNNAHPSVGDISGITKWDNWSGNIKGRVAQEENGNKYLNVNCTSGYQGGMDIVNDIVGGYAVVEASFLYNSGANAANLFRVVGLNGAWLATLYPNSGSWSTYADKDAKQPGTSDIFTQTSGTWVDVKITLDFNEKLYSVYMKNSDAESYGDAVVKDYKLTLNTADPGLSALAFQMPTDNIRVTSGLEEKPQIEDSLNVTSSLETVLIPPKGEVIEIPLSAVHKNGNIMTSPSWTLAAECDGVTVDETSGILKVSGDATPCDIQINVTDADAEGAASVSLKKIYYDFNSGNTENWTGEFKTDEGFIDAEGVYNSIRPTFNFPEYVNGKVVVSAKLRRRNGVQYNTAGMSFRMKSTQYTHWSIGMLIYNNADGKAVYSVSNRNYKQIPNMVLDDDGWFDFKMIVDPSVGKYMTLINGKPFTREEILFDMATPADAKYLDFMFNCDIDDFAVYNAPANMPVAGNATIQKAAVGAEATASYTYYDCLAADEGESTYQWFIADSANGVFTPIDGASGRTYIPNEADKGKYIKYTVTPKNSKGYAGSSAESEPARVIGAEIMHDFKVNSIAYDGYLAAFTEGSNNVSFIINASNHQASGTEYVTGIIAIYRSGELIDIKFDNLSLNPGVSDAIDLSCDFNIAEGETGIYRAAAFIWNNLSEMTPYGKTMIME